MFLHNRSIKAFVDMPWLHFLTALAVLFTSRGLRFLAVLAVVVGFVSIFC